MGKALSDPLELPCGLVLPNRLVKAALQENMADSRNFPDETYFKAYSQWASGNWGAILTGNVMVDIGHLGQSKDIAIRDSTQLSTADLKAQEAAWKRWVSGSQKHGNPTIVQLNHPGRQSPAGAGSRGFFGKTVAPSAIPLNLGDGYLACLARSFIFGTPRALTIPEIEEIVQKFAKSAKFCSDVGMSGVELHAAHGYLLAQFLSPKSNERTDAYGGTPEKRAKIVLDIINETRKLVPKTFCIGIKLNSADVQHASSMDETLHQIALIADAGVDFMEISGGTYEDPLMMGSSRPPKSARTAEREAFFIDFAQAVRAKFPSLTLMLTGGFRTRAGMTAALNSGACDLIGLGRPAIANPSFPKEILNKDVPEEKVQLFLSDVKRPWLAKYVPALGAGAESVFYGSQIQAMGKGLTPKAPEAVV